MVTVSMMVSDAAVSGVRASNLYRDQQQRCQNIAGLDERECFGCFNDLKTTLS